MLLASFALAEIPSITVDDSAIGDSDQAIDIILLMLQQIQGDVSELNSKVDSLQSTSDNLKSTVGGLSVKVRNIEGELAGKRSFTRFV